MHDSDECGRRKGLTKPLKLGGFSLHQRCPINFGLETLFCVGIQEKVLGS